MTDADCEEVLLSQTLTLGSHVFSRHASNMSPQLTVLKKCKFSGICGVAEHNRAQAHAFWMQRESQRQEGQTYVFCSHQALHCKSRDPRHIIVRPN